MTRRSLFGALMALPAVLGAMVAKPRSVFAWNVRSSSRKINRNGHQHVERQATASMHYTILEDPQAFHEMAEGVRLAMIDSLRRSGAPINVWRAGQMRGASDSPNGSVFADEHAAWRDRHYFTVHTRASVEMPPYTMEG